ncbi:hypothetical protein [Spirosoma aerolatum]|uniref:hypothetical protein n=1 Tax=Spirosoma aerolatum TaxID=1211326 RepID=UPI0009AEB0FD|nr:hypothetical protein [Spirosoma aerolatum]
MTEKEVLLDLKRNMEEQLEQLEEMIWWGVDEDDDQFQFLVRKAANYRDTLKKINERLSEL